MNYRVRVMMAAVMVAALLAATAATAAEAPETLPAPNEAVTAVDGTVDVVAEIDHTAATVASDANVDRAVVQTAAASEMTGNVTESMGGLPTAEIGGMGASCSTAAHKCTCVEKCGDKCCNWECGLPNIQPDEVGHVESAEAETPAPDIANFHLQDELNENADNAQEVMGIPPAIVFC